ncbi:MAG: transporter substrate-binding domain-containing protein [Burkholderiales bacterium]|nr:transporter substrate-binding domain-containing protein [Burkholderiales bacterium]
MTVRSNTLSLLLLALPLCCGAADDIVVASPDFWCPFSCEAGSKQEGFTIDILKAIFQPLGRTVHYRNMNYPRALEEVRRGHANATPSTFREEAPDFVFPRLPISRNQYCVYTHVGQTWTYDGPASLRNKKIGIIQGYSYGPRLDAFIRQHPNQFESHTGDDLTLRIATKVVKQRMDGLIEDTNLVHYFMSVHPDFALREAGCEADTHAYFALSPALPISATLANEFDQGMRRLHDTGQLEHIMRQYGLHDWLGPYLLKLPAK